MLLVLYIVGHNVYVHDRDACIISGFHMSMSPLISALYLKGRHTAAGASEKKIW